MLASVGPEQEYFLVDEEKYKQRKDLIFTGRTLFGAMPPKGQKWMTITLNHQTKNRRIHERFKYRSMETWNQCEDRT